MHTSSVSSVQNDPLSQDQFIFFEIFENSLALPIPRRLIVANLAFLAEICTNFSASHFGPLFSVKMLNDLEDQSHFRKQPNLS